jgi:hypothetical protein
MLTLRHHEDVWEHARALLSRHSQSNLWIIKVAEAEVLQLDLVIRGPNVWDRDRMHILGRVVARKLNGRISLVDRG